MNSLLIFAKAPINGFVKTRLKNDTSLSDDEILFLYKAFLMDIILMAISTSADNVYLSYYPKEGEDLMKELVGEFFEEGDLPENLSFLLQAGRDFDERFTKVVKEVMAKSESVVVIGSDSPHIQPRIIEQALNFLKIEGGMVVGPTSEGGAYLIGVSSPLDFSDIFTQGIEMENLVSMAKKNNMPFFLLDELTDLDIASDLITFMCNIEAMEYAAEFNDFYLPKNTIMALKEIGLKVESGAGGERGRKLQKSD
jgi:glycosyltransferase A (GT-A) superfamily protein (DUF2064 family)